MSPQMSQQMSPRKEMVVVAMGLAQQEQEMEMVLASRRTSEDCWTLKQRRLLTLPYLFQMVQAADGRAGNRSSRAPMKMVSRVGQELAVHHQHQEGRPALRHPPRQTHHRERCCG